MSDTSPPTFSYYSRHSLPREEAELSAFAAAVTAAELDIYIEEAFYDSVSNCCSFTFRLGLSAHDEDAKALLSIASKTISQFDWFGSVKHGNGLDEEEFGPWFKEKKHQVIPCSLTAFGIHLDSRYGKASELAEMLNFSQKLAAARLESLIERVEYDSKAAICSFDFISEFSGADPRAAQVLEIALETLSHFDWFGEDRFGFGLRDQ